jgi:hypothetical protein
MHNKEMRGPSLQAQIGLKVIYVILVSLDRVAIILILKLREEHAHYLDGLYFTAYGH